MVAPPEGWHPPPTGNPGSAPDSYTFMCSYFYLPTVQHIAILNINTKIF